MQDGRTPSARIKELDTVQGSAYPFAPPPATGRLPRARAATAWVGCAPCSGSAPASGAAAMARVGGTGDRRYEGNSRATKVIGVIL
eukprot:6203844-Pleurochrysis_carterae.AAC.1